MDGIYLHLNNFVDNLIDRKMFKEQSEATLMDMSSPDLHLNEIDIPSNNDIGREWYCHRVKEMLSKADLDDVIHISPYKPTPNAWKVLLHGTINIKSNPYFFGLLTGSWRMVHYVLRSNGANAVLDCFGDLYLTHCESNKPLKSYSLDLNKTARIENNPSSSNLIKIFHESGDTIVAAPSNDNAMELIDCIRFLENWSQRNRIFSTTGGWNCVSSTPQFTKNL